MFCGVISTNPSFGIVMKVIGKRQKGIEFGYLAIFLIFSFLGVLGIFIEKDTKGWIAGVMGIVLVIWSMAIFIDIIRTPKVIIEYNQIDSTIILKNTIVISISSIEDVSYVRARGKGIRLDWGKVIIKTKSEEYICNYLEDCEEVSKILTKLMYKNEL